MKEAIDRQCLVVVVGELSAREQKMDGFVGVRKKVL
jgi:hypothetical protein